MQNLRVTFAFVLISLFGHGTAHSQWTAIDLGTSSGLPLWATAINSSGQVVGSLRLSTGQNAAFVTGPNASNPLALTDVPATDGTGANDINDSGEVVGYYRTTSGTISAFRTGPGAASFLPLGTFGGSITDAQAINSSGQIAGYSFNTSNLTRSFLAQPGSGQILELPISGTGITGSEATAINASGQAAGTIHFGSSYHAYVTGTSGIVDLGTMGGVSSYARDIDPNGRVVGFFRLNNTGNSPNRGFITGPNGQDIQIIGTLGGASSTALAINSLGQIVGNAGTLTSSHAFYTLLGDLTPIDLNSVFTLPAQAYFDQAIDINDAGQILATASNGRSYLLSPVSEPSALLLFASGLVGMVWRRIAYSRRAERPFSV